MSKENDKFVLQTRLFVIMRRVLTRVIDLEYLRTDAKYAEIILQLAEDSNDEDLLDVAAKLRPLMGLPAKTPATEPAPPPETTRSRQPAARDPVTPEISGQKYVGSLR